MTTGQGILLALKGAAMGAANVIPGVSGGTIALISGIYVELIHMLKSFDREALQMLFQRQFRDAFDHVNGRFITVLAIGLILSWLSLAKLFKHLLATERTEILTMAFFFGLIATSIFSNVSRNGAPNRLSSSLSALLSPEELRYCLTRAKSPRQFTFFCAAPSLWRQ